jgi:hypothetical protein
MFGCADADGFYRLDTLYQQDPYSKNTTTNVSAAAAFETTSTGTGQQGTHLQSAISQEDHADQWLIASIQAGNPTPLQQLWMQADAEEEQRRQTEHRQETQAKQLKQHKTSYRKAKPVNSPVISAGVDNFQYAQSSTTGEIQVGAPPEPFYSMTLNNKGDANIFSSFYKSMLPGARNEILGLNSIGSQTSKAASSGIGNAAGQHAEQMLERLLALRRQNSGQQQLQQHRHSMHNLSSISLHSLQSSGSLTRLLLQDESSEANTRFYKTLDNEAFAVDANPKNWCSRQAP